MSDWLKTRTRSAGVGVDREHEVIRGYIVAQEGPFKDLRGEFNEKGLKAIVKLANASPNGLKSRLAHPTLSEDGVGKFLGRVRDARIDTISTRESWGELKTDEIKVVRGDLHIDPSAHKSPHGDLAEYAMALAESDADAFSTSLVLQVQEEFRLDRKGRRERGEDGEELPPLWMPTRLHASDVVDTGDAVDGMLSLDVLALPDAPAREAALFLDRLFPKLSREEMGKKLDQYRDEYLAYRFGEQKPPEGEWPAILRARLCKKPWWNA